MVEVPPSDMSVLSETESLELTFSRAFSFRNSAHSFCRTRSFARSDLLVPCDWSVSDNIGSILYTDLRTPRRALCPQFIDLRFFLPQYTF